MTESTAQNMIIRVNMRLIRKVLSILDVKEKGGGLIVTKRN